MASALHVDEAAEAVPPVHGLAARAARAAIGMIDAKRAASTLIRDRTAVAPRDVVIDLSFSERCATKRPRQRRSRTRMALHLLSPAARHASPCPELPIVAGRAGNRVPSP